MTATVYKDPQMVNNVRVRLSHWLNSTPTGRKVLFLSQLPTSSFTDEVLSWAWEFGNSYDPPPDSPITEEGWILKKIKWHLLDQYKVRLRNRFSDTTVFFTAVMYGYSKTEGSHKEVPTPVIEWSWDEIDRILDMEELLNPREFKFLEHRLKGWTIHESARLVDRSEPWGDLLQAKIRVLNQESQKE